eukprot:jgi/Botrbrau1/15440/Bobra.43_2s0065.1
MQSLVHICVKCQHFTQICTNNCILSKDARQRIPLSSLFTSMTRNIHASYAHNTNFLSVILFHLPFGPTVSHSLYISRTYSLVLHCTLDWNTVLFYTL